MSGPQCCENPPTLSSSSGAGYVEELGRLKCYISGSFDSKIAVILVSDVFGYEAPKLRKLADKVAVAGFYVVVPDVFNGDPYDPDSAEKPLLVWLKEHSPEQAFQDLIPVTEAIKEKGASKIGAAGFCWGGKVAVELAKSAHVDAAVLLHPSFVTNDDIQGVQVPTSILGAEVDHRSPPEVLKQFADILDKKPEVASFVKVFQGVSHGWSLRYEDEDEKVAKTAEEAHDDIIDWFVKHLR